ncbi:MAG: type II toxin-antitoxin system RelE/ParE family toxin [Candidatus Cloacimonetes bacterium]|nr:type II toxin-antitoxin system RelE/ParE family toxin [Candidatus Cloacimonadota bacterium]
MKIKPLRGDLQKVLGRHTLEKKFQKQAKYFEENSTHPSLKTEKLEPKNLNLYSFRINKKWRAIFLVDKNHQAEIIDINPHYQ